MQESTLILQLQEKKTQNSAFEVLLELYQQRLYWHIRKIVIDHDDADDVLQNTFIKVFRYIDNFKGDCKLYTWLYRIATNEALSFLKSKAKQNKVSMEGLQQDAIEQLVSDPYFEGDEIQIKLQKAIATLPHKQQLVFNMRYFDEIKYAEMSEILETSEGALKASYHIAVKKIEAFLKTD